MSEVNKQLASNISVLGDNPGEANAVNPGGAPRRVSQENTVFEERQDDGGGVLSNAIQRTDNDYNGIENDRSLIGDDVGDDEEELEE